MRIVGELSFAQWMELGQQLLAQVNATKWWIADWAFYGDGRYPDRYQTILDATGLDYDTIRKYAWVAGNFDASRRRDKLSFTHHQIVAALRVEEQDSWLARAEEHGWTSRDLAAQVGACSARNIQAISSGSLFSLRPTPEQLERWSGKAAEAGLELQEWAIAGLDRLAEEAA